MDKDISTLLREIKTLTQLSEQCIAAALGTSQPTVNRILKGQTDCKGRTLKAIQALHAVHCGDAKVISAKQEPVSTAANLK